MKKYILTLLVAMAAAFGAMAQDMTPAFTLTTNQGDDVRFLFRTQPEITFAENGTDLLISDKEGTKVTYAMADVKNITFSMVDAVESVAGEATSIFFDGNILRASGLEAGARAAIYSLSGSIVASACADEQGNLEINLADLQSGVYVAAVGAHSFKFIH